MGCIRSDGVAFGVMGSGAKQRACVQNDGVVFGVMGSRSKQWAAFGMTGLRLE